MKIAILVTGRIDSFKMCSLSYDKIFQGYDCDIYGCFDSFDNNIKEINGFDFKKIRLIKEDIFKEKSQKEKRLFPYLYKQMLGINLLENVNLNYDWIIFIRNNLNFNEKIENLNIVDNNNIYIPVHDNWCGLNDNFAFGNFNNMKWYLSRYLYIDDSIYMLRNVEPELFLYVWLIQKKISLKRCNITYNMIRNNYKINSIFNGINDCKEINFNLNNYNINFDLLKYKILLDDFYKLNGENYYDI